MGQNYLPPIFCELYAKPDVAKDVREGKKCMLIFCEKAFILEQNFLKFMIICICIYHKLYSKQ